MRIISPYKDYYDFAAHLYGKPDASIVYLRDRIKLDQTQPWVDTFCDNSTVVKHNRIVDSYPYDRKDEYDYKWLFVAGKRYLTYRHLVKKAFHSGENEYERRVVFGDRLNSLVGSERLYNRILGKTYKEEDFIGTDDNVLTAIAKTIKAPVFLLHDYRSNPGTNMYHYEIDENIPNLGDLGMSKFITPGQMYQDISQFMSDVLRDNPDTQPPVKLSNNDLIEKHGFDLKTSFRKEKEKVS